MPRGATENLLSYEQAGFPVNLYPGETPRAMMPDYQRSPGQRMSSTFINTKVDMNNASVSRSSADKRVVVERKLAEEKADILKERLKAAESNKAKAEMEEERCTVQIDQLIADRARYSADRKRFEQEFVNLLIFILKYFYFFLFFHN